MNERDSELGRVFDGVAREATMQDFSAEERAKIDRFAARWRIEPGDRVLEPGCGAGRLTELLARAVGPRGAVLACDVSEEMVRRAKARVPSPPAEVRVASLTDLASPAAQFDQAVLLNVLPHFTDLPRALGALRRLLRPGGALWIHHLAASAEVNAFHRKLSPPLDTHFIPEAPELRAALAAAKFEAVSIEDGDGVFALFARRS